MTGFIDGIYFNECNYPGEMNLGKSYRKKKGEGYLKKEESSYGD